MLCADNRPVCVTEQGLLRQLIDVALMSSSAVKLACLWNTKIFDTPLMSLFINWMLYADKSTNSHR